MRSYVSDRNVSGVDRIILMYLLIAFTMVVGLVLSLVQLPHWLAWARPAWLVMLTIYWVLVLPHRVGVTIAWVVGLLYDALHGNLLGQHAVSLSFVAFLTFLIHLRLRVFPMWQQMLTIFIFTGIYQLILRVLQGLVGDVTDNPLYWLPSLVSACIWPTLLAVMSCVSRRYRVLV